MLVQSRSGEFCNYFDYLLTIILCFDLFCSFLLRGGGGGDVSGQGCGGVGG